MRALLDHTARNKPRLSEYDEDALTLYRSISLMTSRMTPNYQDVEQTEIYRHGREIASHMNRTRPHEKAADILARRELTWPQFCRWRLARFREAWERRLPELHFRSRSKATVFFIASGKADGMRMPDSMRT
jgi:hypothetical protein